MFRTEKYRAEVALLRSVPGISTLTAMTLLTELYTIRRFSSLDHLASYAVLIPKIKSSGEEECASGITHRPNAMLMTVLVETCRVTVRKERPDHGNGFSSALPKNEKDQGYCGCCQEAFKPHSLCSQKSTAICSSLC